MSALLQAVPSNTNWHVPGDSHHTEIWVVDDDQCGACHNRHIEIWASAGERWLRLHSSHFHKNIDLGKGRSLTQKSPFERVW